MPFPRALPAIPRAPWPRITIILRLIRATLPAPAASAPGLAAYPNDNHIVYAGVLCREFLSAHLPLSTPVVMSGSGDQEPSTVGGFLYTEQDTLSSATPKDANQLGSKVVGETDGSVATTRTATTVSPRAPSGRSSFARDGETPGTPVDVASVGGTPENRGSVGGKGEENGGGKEQGGVHVCTVGDLYPYKNMYGITERGDQLRLGFLKQQVICLAKCR